jgi:FAD synthase
LRDERAFASEDELVRQIAADVEATQQAVRPS